MGTPELGLIGDIGATYSRFALVTSDGPVSPARVYATNEHRSLFEIIETYLRDERRKSRPRKGLLAVAAPIYGDSVSLTNHPWTFSIAGLQDRLGFRLHVINDFAANALAIPHLGTDDRIQIGTGVAVEGAPVGIIGPGTGLGVAGLIFSSEQPIPIATEGGHVTMAPASSKESALLDVMRVRYHHVSAERLLSGPGLINLYNALCELEAVQATPYSSAQITSPEIWRIDHRAKEATDIFCGMLGTIAGNLALTLGTRGGIYIAGGIVPKLGQFFADSEFRVRFEAKGRFQQHLATIPTYVILRPLPALLAATALIRDLPG